MLAMMAKSHELADSASMVVTVALVVGCYAGDLARELANEYPLLYMLRGGDWCPNSSQMVQLIKGSSFLCIRNFGFDLFYIHLVVVII